VLTRAFFIIMKKLFSAKLRERTETIELRRIKAELNKAAQNNRKEFIIIHIKPETIVALQNEGIRFEQFTEFGTTKYRLTWALSDEERLASQIKWSVDFSERHISVPQQQLTEAEENAFVKELRNLGFHIQSAIV
jgi:hypothetical protein